MSAFWSLCSEKIIRTKLSWSGLSWIGLFGGGVGLSLVSAFTEAEVCCSCCCSCCWGSSWWGSSFTCCSSLCFGRPSPSAKSEFKLDSGNKSSWLTGSAFGLGILIMTGWPTLETSFSIRALVVASSFSDPSETFTKSDSNFEISFEEVGFDLKSFWPEATFLIGFSFIPITDDRVLSVTCCAKSDPSSLEDKMTKMSALIFSPSRPFDQSEDPIWWWTKTAKLLSTELADF